MRTSLTLAIWAVSLTCVAIAGLIATVLVLIPTSMDPTDMINAGTDPWIDALWAVAAFIGLVVVAGLALRLWHSVRFKTAAIALVAGEIVAVTWASLTLYRDYF